jgi:hypothetical protein
MHLDAAAHEVGLADGNSAGYANAGQHQAHDACRLLASADAALTPASRALFVFPEPVRDQLYETVSRFLFVLARSDDAQFRAAGSRQHHDPHDALAVDPLPILREIDAAREGRGGGDKLGGGTGMQAELVDDGDRTFLNVRMPASSG